MVAVDEQKRNCAVEICTIKHLSKEVKFDHFRKNDDNKGFIYLFRSNNVTYCVCVAMSVF